MAVTGFRISRLTLVGRGVPNAEVQFSAGLNIISGPSDTGKTFIIQCIDYMLGGTKEPKSIPESERYESVRLSLHQGNNAPEIELERSLRGGDFNLYVEGQADRTLSAKHKADDKNNISQYLLNLSGMTGRKVRTNQQGKTREVSFRDLARLVLIDEEAVISEKSPIHSGQVINATVESAVFRLLLTGVDDASLVASEDPKMAKGKEAGKAEMLELLLNRTRGRLAELQLPGDAVEWRDKLKQVESLYDAAEKELATEQQSAAKLEERRRIAWNQLRRVESRADVLSELQRRFELLQQQYLSDMRRLESTAEAGTRLGQMNEERCPVCGALAEHHEHDHQNPDAAPEDVAQACLAEVSKIKALLSDLHLTRMQNDEDIRRLLSDGEKERRELQEAGDELQERLKPRIKTALLRFREHQIQRDTYRLAVDLTGRLNEFQGLLSELGTLKTEKGTSLPSVKVRADEADHFSKEVESLLRRWHFPNLDRVTFSEGDQDVVISGRKRASHGKGVRAIAHAAFNLALLNYCRRQMRPHPGLVLIDSPLVVYREPDNDEGIFSRDVKDAFYRSVAEEFKDSQVIIFENEDPPADLEHSTNVIRFTGAGHGRRGFIPSDA